MSVLLSCRANGALLGRRVSDEPSKGVFAKCILLLCGCVLRLKIKMHGRWNPIINEDHFAARFVPILSYIEYVVCRFVPAGRTVNGFSEIG
jgi:hypothetical protein